MKRKILDFSVMKEEISQNNVLEMSELIAFMELRLNARFLYFCYKGVAGIVFETRKPTKSTVYLTQPRDTKGLFIK